MTSRALVFLAWFLVASPGCRDAPTGDRTNPSPPEVVETHPEERNAIHLNADMVRDLRISTANVTERSGANEVVALGEVSADQSRYAEVAPPTGGQIVRLLVESNALVEPGTPLAQLRSMELGRAHVELITAEARRDRARVTFERKKTLAFDRIIPQRELDEAEALLSAASADVRAATAAISAFGVSGSGDRDDPSLFFVRSPIAGRVLDRPAILGKFAAPSDVLFTVADLTRVWVMAHAFERDAVTVTVGSVAHVTVAALPGQEFDGRVTVVGRVVEPGSRTVPIRVEVANPGGTLRPGMSASTRLEVMGANRTILTVPAAALQRVGDRWLVFIPKGEHEYEMRPVGRGRELGNDVEVVSGIKAGDTVVVDGAFLLKAEAEKRAGGADAHGH